LRANASRALGRLEAEARAIEMRHRLLEEQLADTGRAETAQEAMLAEAQLAVNASRRRDPAGAARWLGLAMGRADDLRARSHGVSGRESLDVLWLAAQLTVSMGRPLVPDLPKRLDDAATEVAARREPSLRSYERWFEIYRPLVTPTGSTVSAAGAASNRDAKATR
jgi:hypothetical protein